MEHPRGADADEALATSMRMRRMRSVREADGGWWKEDGG